MLPRGGNSVTVELDGTVSDDGKPGKAITSRWSVQAGPGTVRITDAARLKTNVTLSGQGVYHLNLAASDGAAVLIDRFLRKLKEEYGGSRPTRRA